MRPAALDDGLGRMPCASLARARADSGRASTSTDERFEDRIETAAYFVASEGLANAVKHARAATVAVGGRRAATAASSCAVTRRRRRRRAAVERLRSAPGSRDRVAALGGSVAVDELARRGTAVVAELPCGS